MEGWWRYGKWNDEEVYARWGGLCKIRSICRPQGKYVHIKSMIDYSTCEQVLVFLTIHIFLCAVFAVRQALILKYLFLALTQNLVERVQESSTQDRAQRTEQNTFSLSLSLSLSHTHTHTYIHTYIHTMISFLDSLNIKSTDQPEHPTCSDLIFQAKRSYATSEHWTQWIHWAW